MSAHERWRQATDIRDEWLGWALSTLPADRKAAEAAITELYRLIGYDPPRFVWVDSPGAALSELPPARKLRESELPTRSADWPVANQLATLQADLRRHLDARIDKRLISDRLRDIVRDAICTPLRLELGDDGVNLAWRGQHDAYWVGHYDAWIRAWGIRTRAQGQLDLWAALARSCGWWWPYDDVCVVSERTAEVHLEDGVGLHADGGPAVRYRDGWAVHAWHGTRVPAWVMTGPTADLITRERNVEVRRCAIERIGWETYLDQASLRLVGEAPDPGNQGSRLMLYDLPGRKSRLLVAVNGSLERDGRRRKYGLSVPAYLDDPIDAAAWTYGLSGAHYAQLARRT